MEIVPEDLMRMDPASPQFRSSLKFWVKENIPPNGDHIFKGNLYPPEKEKDWLVKEVEKWYERESHNFFSQVEFEELEAT